MVPPKGPALARSTSTWIHWWSPVASAKASTRSWVISNQSVVPRSAPIASVSSSKVVKVRMPGTYPAAHGSVLQAPGVRHGRGDDGAVGAAYAVPDPRGRVARQPGALPVQRYDDRLVGGDLHELAADRELDLLAVLDREAHLLRLDPDPQPGALEGEPVGQRRPLLGQPR